MSRKGTALKVLETQTLTVTQEKAISLMGEGMSLPETATQLGVSRGTIYRWLRDEPEFIAAFNAWRKDQTRTARARLLTISESAVTAVQTAIEQGNAKLAFDLIKHLGLLSPEPEGSDDPKVVRRQNEIAKRTQMQKLGEEEMNQEMGLYATFEKDGEDLI